MLLLYVFDKCFSLHRNDKEENKENKKEKSKITIKKEKKKIVKEHRRRSCLQEAVTVILISKTLNSFTKNRQLLSEVSKAEKRQSV